MTQLAINGGPAVRTEPWPRWPAYGPKVMAAIERVAQSQNYHPQFGQETEAFEQAFAEYHGVGHAAGVAHGTLALQLAMSVLEIGPGDEVIVPAYTYVASASAAADEGATPVFVDSEPISQGLDPADVRRKITERTKAIVVVHTNGYPADMDAIMAIAGEHNLRVIEDCSHAHGATHRGRKVGTIGDIGAFSLQQKKNLSAGCGGVAITRDEQLAHRMHNWRTYHWEPVGHNWQMSEFHAAIAGALLPDLDEMNVIRRANVATLLDALGEVEGITPLPGLPDTEPTYYNLILQYDAEAIGIPRGRFVKALQAEGIPIHMFYVPLQRWPIFARGDFGHVSTPVADAICDSINLEIKVHPTSGETEMQQIAEAIRKILAHREQLQPAPAASMKGNA